MSRTSGRATQLPARYRDDEVPDNIRNIKMTAPREERRSGNTPAPPQAPAQARTAAGTPFAIYQDSTAGIPGPILTPPPLRILKRAPASSLNNTPAHPAPPAPPASSVTPDTPDTDTPGTIDTSDTPETPASPPQPTGPVSSIYWRIVSRPPQKDGNRPAILPLPHTPGALDSFGNPIEAKDQLYPCNPFSMLRPGAVLALLRVMSTYFTFPDSIKLLHLSEDEIEDLTKLLQPSKRETMHEITEEDVQEAKRVVLANVECPSLEEDLCERLDRFVDVETTRNEIDEGDFGKLVENVAVVHECMLMGVSKGITDMFGAVLIDFDRFEDGLF